MSDLLAPSVGPWGGAKRPRPREHPVALVVLAREKGDGPPWHTGLHGGTIHPPAGSKSDLLPIFSRHPLLALALGLLFLFLAARLHRPVIWTAAAAWLVYSLYELGVSARLLCSGECNMRVDLLLVYPLLLGLSAAAVLASLRARSGGARRGDPNEFRRSSLP